MQQLLFFLHQNEPFFPPVSQLKEVVLKSGKVLRADVCVIGAGSKRPFSLFFPAGLLHVKPVDMSLLLQGVFLHQGF